MDGRALRHSGPTRSEDDVDDILTRIPLNELRNRVLYRLMLFEEAGVLEDFTANWARVDVVPEREEGLVGRDIGFGNGSDTRLVVREEGVG